MDDAERLEAEQLLESTPWVRDLLGPPGLLDGDPKVWDGMFKLDASLRPKHYVAGQRSPFIFRGPHLRVDESDDAMAIAASRAAASRADRPSEARFRFRKGGKMGDEGTGRSAVMTWAVYAGHYAINGAYNLQGGATAAIIDYATACAGSTIFRWGMFVLTKVNTIKYLRTAGPVPGVFKVIVELKDYDLEKGDMILHTTLTRDDIAPGERPFATAVTHMVDGPTRKRWKQNQKKKRSVEQPSVVGQIAEGKSMDSLIATTVNNHSINDSFHQQNVSIEGIAGNSSDGSKL